MRDFFFGTGAIAGWVAASTVMLFFAAYVWQIVREVGGIRGAALATMFTSLAILFACFALLLSEDARVPHVVVAVVATAACTPIPFAAFVLCDLYAADRNNHRSFTARSYFWYKRMTRSDAEDSGPHHPVSLLPGGQHAK